MELCHLGDLLHSTGQRPSHSAEAVYPSWLHTGTTWIFATTSKIADCTIPHIPAQAPKGMKRSCKSFRIEFRPTVTVVQVSTPRGCWLELGTRQLLSLECPIQMRYGCPVSQYALVGITNLSFSNRP